MCTLKKQGDRTAANVKKNADGTDPFQKGIIMTAQTKKKCWAGVLPFMEICRSSF